MREGALFVCLYKIVELNGGDEQEVEKVTNVTSNNIHSARTIMEKLLDQSVGDSSILRYEIISIVPKLWKL